MVNAVFPDPTPRAARPFLIGQKKPGDTAEGCRAFEANDRARAETMAGGHVRSALSCSADAWAARAQLLDLIESKFRARTNPNVRRDDRQHGTETNDNG